MASASPSPSPGKEQGMPPYSVKLNPTDALELVKQGASLLILDMPPGTLLGFDLQTLSVGPLFKGIKMIPPGPHFIYYSATNKHENTSQSFFTGFFIHPGPADIIVRRWDPQLEMLVKLCDEDEEERYKMSVKKLEFDQFLGAYDVHHYKAWKRISSHIDAEVIGKFEPVHANISVIHEAEFSDAQAQTRAEKRLQQHLKNSRELFKTRDSVKKRNLNGMCVEDLNIGEEQQQKEITAGKIATDVDNSENMHRIAGEVDVDLVKETMDVDLDKEIMDVDSDKNMPIIERKMDEQYVVTQKVRTDLVNETMDADNARNIDEKHIKCGKIYSDLVKKPSGRCFYTKFPHLVKRSGLTGSQLTMLNIDKSSELERLLINQYKGSEDLLLGELEFSFIAFLMGQSLESFSQWKSIVCLMFSCDEAPLSSRTRLFVSFLDIVCFQLMVGLKPETDANAEMAILDATWFSDDNFLRINFKEFYRLVIEARPVDGDLLKQTRRLKSILEKFLGWTFDLEKSENDDNEYEPVIVPEADL